MLICAVLCSGRFFSLSIGVMKFHRIFLGIGLFLSTWLSTYSPAIWHLSFRPGKFPCITSQWFCPFHFHCSFILKLLLFNIGILGLSLSFSYLLFSLISNCLICPTLWEFIIKFQFSNFFIHTIMFSFSKNLMVSCYYSSINSIPPFISWKILFYKHFFSVLSIISVSFYPIILIRYHLFLLQNLGTCIF